ncbi:TetR/AcrR family transcriptional regulator [Bacillus sp. NP157]|nr:TetR/AcrR family transcriptional regulator [Bacillus sp. NP157]
MTATPSAPVDQAPDVRQQIIDAADEHFSRFGYAKTTMADLARAIGFSKAYLYKFFESKQAIGEAICAGCLGIQRAAIVAAVEAARSPHEKVRALFRTAVELAREQLFEDRQLYDIVTHSCTEKWESSESHVAQLQAMLREIVRQGREIGDFERKTPLDEVCAGIWIAMLPFAHPVLLQHNLDLLDEGMPAVLGLVLRSLAP